MSVSKYAFSAGSTRPTHHLSMEAWMPLMRVEKAQQVVVGKLILILCMANMKFTKGSCNSTLEIARQKSAKLTRMQPLDQELWFR